MLRFNTNTIVEALKGNTADIKDAMGPGAGQQLILLVIILTVMAGAFFFMVQRINRGVA